MFFILNLFKTINSLFFAIGNGYSFFFFLNILFTFYDSDNSERKCFPFINAITLTFSFITKW